MHIEQLVEDANGQMQMVTVHIGESPLAWLHARGHVSERHYLAGDMLRQDWEKSGLGPRVTMRWDEMSRSGGAGEAGRGIDPTMAQMSARKRFDGAVERAGPGLADILWRVVCAGEGLIAAEKALGWPSRAGKLVLILALDRVADWYRIS